MTLSSLGAAAAAVPRMLRMYHPHLNMYFHPGSFLFLVESRDEESIGGCWTMRSKTVKSKTRDQHLGIRYRRFDRELIVHWAAAPLTYTLSVEGSAASARVLTVTLLWVSSRYRCRIGCVNLVRTTAGCIPAAQRHIAEWTRMMQRLTHRSYIWSTLGVVDIF